MQLRTTKTSTQKYCVEVVDAILRCRHGCTHNHSYARRLIAFLSCGPRADEKQLAIVMRSWSRTRQIEDVVPTNLC
jgi:hypothetical protein